MTFYKGDLSRIDYLLNRTRALLKGDIKVVITNKPLGGYDYIIKSVRSTQVAKDTLEYALDRINEMVPEFSILAATIDRKPGTLNLKGLHGLNEVSNQYEASGYLPTPFSDLFICEKL